MNLTMTWQMFLEEGIGYPSSLQGRIVAVK
jgi:hypothetical protein